MEVTPETVVSMEVSPSANDTPVVASNNREMSTKENNNNNNNDEHDCAVNPQQTTPAQTPARKVAENSTKDSSAERTDTLEKPKSETASEPGENNHGDAKTATPVAIVEPSTKGSTEAAKDAAKNDGVAAVTDTTTTPTGSGSNNNSSSSNNSSSNNSSSNNRSSGTNNNSSNSSSNNNSSSSNNSSSGTNNNSSSNNSSGSSSSNNKDIPVDVSDEYSYINRDEFTSEIFKIEIQRMPRFGFSELKKKLVNLGLHPIKVKGFPQKGFAFITFRDETAREKALTTLHGYQWKGHSITAKKSQPTADPLVLKRKFSGGSGDEPHGKRGRESEEMSSAEGLTPDERVRKAVMPLADMPYEEQLKRKSDDIRNVMTRWSKDLQHNCPDLRRWISKQRQTHSGNLCELLAIKPSPLLSGYRNKSEFTIGTNTEGSERVVGFRLGSYRDGSSAVGEVSLCDILPDAMKRVAKVFQEYVRGSQYSVYDAQTHQGNWRQLTVRSSTSGDLMAIIEFHSDDLSEEELTREKAALKEFFSEGEGKVCGVTSLFFNPITNRQSSCRQGASYEHLMGNKWITEHLLGLTFQISPDAFFQINTPATALLYSLVAEWCQLEQDSVVLDICCGTGTIGLTLAKHVKRVLGVELCAAAIEDAKSNASLNGIRNVEFLCSRAEDATERMNSWSRGQKAVAVVDPPRPGLQPKVMYALRRCHFIKRIIYVSCNPVAAIQNFTDLMRPKSRRNKGEPFFAVKAVPVDLFPHTRHCEMVVMFDRKVDPQSEQQRVEAQLGAVGGQPKTAGESADKASETQPPCEADKSCQTQNNEAEKSCQTQTACSDADKVCEADKSCQTQAWQENKVCGTQTSGEADKSCQTQGAACEDDQVGETQTSAWEADKSCQTQAAEGEAHKMQTCDAEKLGEGDQACAMQTCEAQTACETQTVNDAEKSCQTQSVFEADKSCQTQPMACEPESGDKEVPMQS
ncbi:tRNA (uracil-5-)-methyltransferase homolog A [Argonauta hians]